ncbi:hypothetical protein JAAARDRAFT_84670, partial [Jaapia argillacea MUCL 33604]
VELFDSGATRHMSPYHKKFILYQEVGPMPISAANQQSFSVIGVGDMVIEIPNGD